MSLNAALKATAATTPPASFPPSQDIGRRSPALRRVTALCRHRNARLSRSQALHAQGRSPASRHGLSRVFFIANRGAITFTYFSASCLRSGAASVRRSCRAGSGCRAAGARCRPSRPCRRRSSRAARRCRWRWRRPPLARDCMVEVPIFWKLIQRKVSPKPSMRFSKSPSIASGATSRPVTPVPPVLITTSMPGSSIHFFTWARILSMSSVTMARSANTWPSRAMRSTRVSPDLSALACGCRTRSARRSNLASRAWIGLSGS